MDLLTKNRLIVYFHFYRELVTMEISRWARKGCILLTSIRHGGSIKVILTDDLEGRGVKGEVLSVKRGFARNYLIPRQLAGMHHI